MADATRPAGHTPPRVARRTRFLWHTLAAVAALALLALAACAEEERKQEEATTPVPARVYANRVIDYAPGTLVISGTYIDEYGTNHTITPSTWQDDYAMFNVVSRSNADAFLIAQNAATNDFNPDKFSRFDWHLSGDVLYYCQIAYDKDTATDAEAVTAADRDALGTGCGGFSWTQLGAPDWEFFFHPERALGAPEDYSSVVSLGDDGAGEGGSLTLGVGASGDPTQRVCIVDDGTPAADFVVFENPFAFTDANGAANFTEAAYVEVSEDGVNFHRFAATAPNPPDEAIATLVGNPVNFSGLAGIRTLAEGGDAFDLGSLIAQEGGPAVGFRACYVRVVDGGAALADYDRYGALGTQSPSGADIDAVEALHYEADATLAP